MSQILFNKGDNVLVTQPLNGWRAEPPPAISAVIERGGEAYVQVRLTDGRLWTFHQGSGLAATEELSDWRLYPIPVPTRCKHCSKRIIRCETVAEHGGCSSARGYLHDATRAHGCQPRSDGPYAEPASPGA